MTVLPMSTGGEEHSLLVPPLYDVVGSAVVLLIIVVVLYKFALPKFNAILDERERRIEEGLNAADRAHEAEAVARHDAERVMAEAHAEAGRVRAEATEDAKRIVTKAQRDAEEEAARILANARRQIDAERQAAEISLKTDVGMLAADLAEKIVGEHLRDSEATSRVVDRFLSDLEHDTVS